MAAVAIAALAIGLLAMVVKRWQWKRESAALCATAQPLVGKAATEDEVAATFGDSSRFRQGDWPAIEHNFGSASGEKTGDIKRHLGPDETLRVFSRSNAMLFVYFGSNGRAKAASCFLQ
jgi:hypothetical protein